MRILTRNQAKIFDQRMRSELALNDELLVEAVAAQSALHVHRALSRKPELFRNLPLTVVCGGGHNGLDGMVTARHLVAMGIPCEVYWSTSQNELQKAEKERLKLLKVPLHPIDQFRALERKRVCLDALFGVGLNRELDSTTEKIIGHLNRISVFTFSTDVPSGLDVDTGNSFGALVRAAVTLAVGALKPGYFMAEGPEVCGKLHLVQAGFNAILLDDVKPVMKVVLPRALRKMVPRTRRRFHKGSTGKCHLVTGSKLYPGALGLVARGCLSAGGTFMIGHGDPALKEVLKEIPEVIFKSGDDDHWISELSAKDVVVLGSGAPERSLLHRILQRLWEQKHPKVILDADALKALKDLKLKALDSWILTPHPGELAQMTDQTSLEVEADRIRSASLGQEKWGGQVLLKGYQPVLITPLKETWCLPFGDERLGKAGSGDLLSGIIAGLWSQMEEGCEATALGVFLQAEASRLLSGHRSRRSLLPSEIPGAIGQVLARLQIKSKS